MRISGSIVLYNNDIAILKQAIESFLACNDVLQLYLIDNSPKDYLSTLKDLDKRIVYIFNPSNPGFGAAHNIAINEILSAGYDFHLVLNPDVYFRKEAMEALITYIKDKPEIGNIMPKVLYPNGEIQYLCKLLPTPYDWIGRRFNPFKSLVRRRNHKFELRFTEYNKIMEVPYLSGCFMLLNVEALKKVGNFDENIFMYGEETDLCRRLIGGGFKTVFYPQATIYHHFAKGSHNTWRLTRVGINSAIYYFNKWGWLFDKDRKVINKNTLEKLAK